MPSHPPVARRDGLVEDLHGHRIADPYRWMEDRGDPDLDPWIEGQNEVTRAHLDAVSQRPLLRRRLRALWRHPRRGVPWRRGRVWLESRNDGDQDQDVLWVAEAPADSPARPPDEDRWRVLIDPNERSEAGVVALTATALSDDGTLLAYALSEAGSDWMTWRVVETTTGRERDDEVPWAKFAGAAWLPDGSGFVYGAFDRPPPGHEHEAANRDHRLRVHRLGRDAADDEVVYARPDQPEWGFGPEVTHDGRWLIVTVSHGTHVETRVHVAPIADGSVGEVEPLLDRGDAAWTPIGVVGDRLWVVTDLGAPRSRVVAVALPSVGGGAGRGRPDVDVGRDGTAAQDETADQRPVELVPEGEHRLERALLVGAATVDEPGWLLTLTLDHARHRLAARPVHDATSLGPARTLELPNAATVVGLAGGRHDTTAFATVETFDAPPAVVAYDLFGTGWARVGRGAGDAGAGPAAGAADVGPGAGAAHADPGAAAPDETEAAAPDETRPIARQVRFRGLDPDDDLVVDQVFVEHGRTRVPVFLFRHRATGPTGDVPTVLWGYGGFNIAVTPAFRPAWRVWAAAGGLVAVANLRGGGEYGREWYEDGRLDAKQHVFDDAIAVAEWLTGAGGWTTSSSLGVEGRSNGGLLVGACLTQRPDLWGSAVPEVGVLDMVRFHRFTIGWAWASDYGSADDPEQIGWLLGYSPLHRIEDGRCYPPTLVTTGDTDDRVVPAHSYKFAAALQHAQGCDRPVLIRVDTSAGHGVGKPVSKQIDERADVLAFHAHHLGLSLDS